jgi:uncharacterized protein (TIGR02147 family)
VGRRSPNIAVFGYLNYRAYLKDWYEDAKKNHPGFSFRSFSQAAGFRSTNFYKLVMDGNRNLTEKSILPFMCGLRLTKQEQDFFKNLVFFTQARTFDKKDFYYQKMLQSRRFSALKPLDKKAYDFMTCWYHPVVRELVMADDFDGTPEYVSERVRPHITVAQAAKSLELLAALGFIQKTPEGRWTQVDALITTGAELKSRALLLYHQNLLELARTRLTEISPENRDVSSLTLGILPEQLPVLKEKIREFRSEIIKLVSTNENSSEVVLLNIQLLPVTGPRENGEGMEAPEENDLP